MADRRHVWTGYAAAGCAVLWLPLHLYYALGGTAGGSAAAPLVDVLPDWLPPSAAELTWRLLHLGIAVLLAAVAVLAVAVVRPWGRRLPSAALIVPAFAVTVAALSYAVGALASGTVELAGWAVPETVRGAAAAVGLDGNGLAGRLASNGLAGNGLAGLLGEAGSGGVRLAAWGTGGWPGGPSAYQLLSLGPWALALGVTLGLAVSARLSPVARRIWLVAVALGVLRLVL